MERRPIAQKGFQFMSFKAQVFVAAALAGAAAIVRPDIAGASVINGTLALGYQETASGTTGTGAVNSVAVPGTYLYGDSFSSPTPSISGYPSYGFYDDFLFSIGGATVDSITSTINIKNLSYINNLQVRLYNESGNPTLPVLGKPNGTVIDSWSVPINWDDQKQTVDVLPPTTLGAGTYVLEIRGDATGKAGGSYAGLLNLEPVPLPGGLPLLLSGLGFLGAMVQLRKLLPGLPAHVFAQHARIGLS